MSYRDIYWNSNMHAPRIREKCMTGELRECRWCVWWIHPPVLPCISIANVSEMFRTGAIRNTKSIWTPVNVYGLSVVGWLQALSLTHTHTYTLSWMQMKSSQLLWYSLFSHLKENVYEVTDMCLWQNMCFYAICTVLCKSLKPSLHLLYFACKETNFLEILNLWKTATC